VGWPPWRRTRAGCGWADLRWRQNWGGALSPLVMAAGRCSSAGWQVRAPSQAARRLHGATGDGHHAGRFSAQSPGQVIEGQLTRLARFRPPARFQRQGSLILPRPPLSGESRRRRRALWPFQAVVRIRHPLGHGEFPPPSAAGGCQGRGAAAPGRGFSLLGAGEPFEVPPGRLRSLAHHQSPLGKPQRLEQRADPDLEAYRDR